MYSEKAGRWKNNVIKIIFGFFKGLENKKKNRLKQVDK